MRSMLLSAVVGMGVPGLSAALPSAARADEMPATIRVSLPADATLTINGQPTKSTSGVRTFRTPAIESGKDFHYDLRATVVRGEQTLTIDRRVTVRAGQQAQVALTPSGTADDNRAYYYDPAAPQSGTPFVARPAAVIPDLSPLAADVGGARNNWRADPSDPFAHSGQ